MRILLRPSACHSATYAFVLAVGSPAGLTITNDDELYQLLADLESWKSNLPEDLQFRGPESPRSAGMSHSIMCAVMGGHLNPVSGY